jgi:hypothetical protein
MTPHQWKLFARFMRAVLWLLASDEYEQDYVRKLRDKLAKEQQ